MGDGSAIGGWILTAAIITVLAGGASAVNSGSGGSDSSSGTPGGATTTAASRSAARAGEPSTKRPRPGCTKIVTRYSTDRTKYTQYPANTAGTLGCGMIRGDSGPPVLTLKRALRQCSDGARGLTDGGAFDASTATVLSRAQADLKTIRTDGVYDAETAVRLDYPWYEVKTNRFTGLCSPTGTRVP